MDLYCYSRGPFAQNKSSLQGIPRASFMVGPPAVSVADVDGGFKLLLEIFRRSRYWELMPEIYGPESDNI